MNTVTEHRGHLVPHLRLGSPWLRARVWLNRQSLDRRLAHGESTLASPELARRGEQLASIRSRHSLAVGIRRVLGDAERPRRALSAAAPVQRRPILDARARLEQLAADLDAHEPVKLAGIARVRLLLTDGASPLYSPHPQGALDEAVAHAQAALVLD
jgi:hypothetical protein